MSIKFTNNYTILKDILKIEYTFILSLLFNNFDDIIHLLKEKKPFYGEVLEYLYLSMPTFYNSTHDKICQQFRYIDSILRILYKNNKKNICAEFKEDVKNICNDFHIVESEFEYYYYIALLIISLENNINSDAYNLYAQFNDNIRDNIYDFENQLFNMLSINEYQCLFYNHLEDVYANNLSEDGKISVIHKDNYSYFLDNNSAKYYLTPYLKKVDNKRYPLIITNEYIYNIVNDKPNILSANNINSDIFNDNVRYIASYYTNDNSIRNWIPFFSYFHTYNNLQNDICYPLYNEYYVHHKIDNDNIHDSQDILYFDSDIENNIHYYVNKFTVYRPFMDNNDESVND